VEGRRAVCLRGPRGGAGAGGTRTLRGRHGVHATHTHLPVEEGFLLRERVALLRNWLVSLAASVAQPNGHTACAQAGWTLRALLGLATGLIQVLSG